LRRWADLVVIECDLCYRALHSAEKARRCGTCPVGVLVNWWSDLEGDASEAADFVLHVPLTADEIRHVLAAVPMRPNRERAVSLSPGHGSRLCSRTGRGAHKRGRVRQALKEP
jgi:hypothetical protein